MFIADSLTFGGGGYGAFKLATELAKQGHRIHFVTANVETFEASMATFEIPSQFRFVGRPSVPRVHKGFGLLDRWWTRIFDRIVLRQRIRGTVIDWVVGLQGPDATRSVALGRRLGAKVANLVFETPDLVLSNARTGGELTEHEIRLQSTALVGRWAAFEAALKKTDTAFTISKIVDDEYRSWIGADNSTIIFAGVDVEDARAATVGVPKRDQIIYVGRLVSYKNVDEIIKAISAIDNPPTLVIVGDGREKAGLIRLARDLAVDCTFMGWVTESDKWELIAESRLLILPSSQEGFGIPPAEALACGTAALVSDIPVLQEIYKHTAWTNRKN